MHRGSLGAQRDEGVRIVRGDGRGIETATGCGQSLGDLMRSREGGLERDLLVEQHAHQQRERVAGEQFVGGGIAGDVNRGGHAPPSCHPNP